MKPRAAFFLDRDGVIIEEAHYLSDPAEVRLIEGSARAIAQLNRLGIPVVVITNQSGVAHGHFPESQVAEIHRQLDRLLAVERARVDRYYYCPHHSSAERRRYRRACDCRKPRPGMLLAAARELGLDLHRSALVGDKLSDLEAGIAAGCRPILVRTGYGTATERWLGRLAGQSVEVAADLAGAVEAHAHVPAFVRVTQSQGDSSDLAATPVSSLCGTPPPLPETSRRM